MTPSEAFEAYRRVRHRLPAAPEDVKPPQRAGTLADIADQYDAFLLDGFGVLNVGEGVVPGALERVASLRSAGKRVLLVTNAAGYPKSRLMARYDRLGFDFAERDVISSRDALLLHLQGLMPRRWGLVADPAFGRAELEGLDAEFLADEPQIYDAVEGFLLIGSGTWTDARQALLEAALERNPRPVLVGNPDLIAPREGALSLEPGYYAHHLADRTGVVPQFFGKPFPNVFDLARERLGQMEPERVVMVGDTLHTDVLGGAASGFATALVHQHGTLARMDPLDACSQAGIRPDWILDQT